MSVSGPLIEEPPDELLYHHKVSLLTSVREVILARELVRSLAERQLRARYKQALLGFLWSFITPIILMVAFTLVFTKVTKIATGGAPYPLFSYLGLLPWTFFSNSVSSGSTSIVTNTNLINKIYCPRE